ncbi:PAAR-like domain-containing protein, partial [Methylobacterium sp. Leaf87]
MSGGSSSVTLEPLSVYGAAPAADPALAQELGLPSNALFQSPERGQGYADYKLPGDDLASQDYRRAYFDKDARKDENWAPPSPSAPKPPPPELIPDTHEAIAVSTSPDVCRSPSAPVPYAVWGKADDKQNYSPDVRSNGCVIKRRDSRFTTTYG